MGAIRAAVAATLTPARVAEAAAPGAPKITEADFIGALSQQMCVSGEDVAQMRDFQDIICKYDEARLMEDPAAAAAAAKTKK